MRDEGVGCGAWDDGGVEASWRWCAVRKGECRRDGERRRSRRGRGAAKKLRGTAQRPAHTPPHSTPHHTTALCTSPLLLPSDCLSPARDLGARLGERLAALGRHDRGDVLGGVRGELVPPACSRVCVCVFEGARVCGRKVGADSERCGCCCCSRRVPHSPAPYPPPHCAVLSPFHAPKPLPLSPTELPAHPRQPLCSPPAQRRAALLGGERRPRRLHRVRRCNRRERLVAAVARERRDGPPGRGVVDLFC